jgi:ribosomal protein L30E
MFVAKASRTNKEGKVIVISERIKHWDTNDILYGSGLSIMIKILFICHGTPVLL